LVWHISGKCILVRFVLVMGAVRVI